MGDHLGARRADRARAWRARSSTARKKPAALGPHRREIEAESPASPPASRPCSSPKARSGERVLGFSRRCNIGLKEQVQTGEDAARQRRFGVTGAGRAPPRSSPTAVQRAPTSTASFERLPHRVRDRSRAVAAAAVLPEGVDAETAPKKLREARNGSCARSGRSSPARARGVREEEGALHVPHPAARGPAQGQGAAARGDREDQRDGEPDVLGDVREGARQLQGHLQDAVRKAATASCA